jgi:hypothetical protein
MPDDLVPGRIDDRDLAVEDCDERVRPIADLIQQLTGGRSALLTDLGESRQLRRRKLRAGGGGC